MLVAACLVLGQGSSGSFRVMAPGMPFGSAGPSLAGPRVGELSLPWLPPPLLGGVLCKVEPAFCRGAPVPAVGKTGWACLRDPSAQHHQPGSEETVPLCPALVWPPLEHHMRFWAPQ